MPAQLSFLTEWFETTIAGSPIWSAIGLVAAALVGLYLFWRVVKAFAALVRMISTSMASRKRRSTQGFGIAISPLMGPQGNAQTKAIFAALEEHLSLFTFGSPFELVRAPRMRAKGSKGLRAAATEWLEKSSTDLVLWGYRPRGKAEAARVEVLSLGGSLTPSDAMHSEGLLPYISKTNKETTSRVVAYLVARAIQPGLSDGTAFRPDKLAPVADLLMECLQGRDQLPDRTLLTLETDYCSMALALETDAHLQRVIEMRRRRLAADESMHPTFEIQARIDLGRALLMQSKTNFDPVRVREAMDHLKIAVDRLKADPTLRLAQATNIAVQQGQAMLSNRKRFSVTGGSTI
ncbi:MAG: heme biosynthesis HemY N-terminal domain-containing protein [Hyphomonadaceae bacterium]|nr:heme biosynthesis HemY N-terminal domain-containing protein [Hyphomonadaceae bacterium]